MIKGEKQAKARCDKAWDCAITKLEKELKKPTCRNCRFWFNGFPDTIQTTYKLCGNDKVGGKKKITNGLQAVNMRQDKWFKPLPMDYYIITNPEFGCVHFEPKSVIHKATKTGKLGNRYYIIESSKGK